MFIPSTPAKESHDLLQFDEQKDRNPAWALIKDRPLETCYDVLCDAPTFQVLSGFLQPTGQISPVNVGQPCFLSSTSNRRNKSVVFGCHRPAGLRAYLFNAHFFLCSVPDKYPHIPLLTPHRSTSWTGLRFMTARRRLTNTRKSAPRISCCWDRQTGLCSCSSRLMRTMTVTMWIA